MSFGFGLAFPRNINASFSPYALFSSGEQGVWYDPSDINLAWRRNLLTYTEQFDNGAWLKLGTGAPTIQTNLLTYSEQFDNAIWSYSEGTLSSTAVINPFGGATSYLYTPSTTGSNVHYVRQSPVGPYNSVTMSLYVKSNGYTKFALRESAASGAYASFDISSATVLDTGLGTGVTAISASAPISVGNGWYRVTVSFTGNISYRFGIWALPASYTTGQPVSITWSGDGTSGFYIWGAQLVQGATAGNYQATTSAVAAVQYTAPDGTLTADNIVEFNGSTQGYVASYTNAIPASTTPGQRFCFTVNVKAAGRNFVFLRLHNNTASLGASGVIVNLTTGAITYPATPYDTTLTASVSDVSGGWWRVTLASTTTSGAIAASGGPGIWPCASTSFVNAGGDGPATYTGDGTSGIFIWGAQLEAGSTASAYQKITDGVQDYFTYGSATPILYQDAAGTTPVTAVEQPVGLMLDKSKGLVLGSELINNSAWTVGAGWSVNSTSGVATGSNVTGAIRNNLAGGATLTVGRWYQATIRLVSYTSGSVGYPYDGTGLINIPTTPGTYTHRFLCDNPDYTYVYGTAFTGVVDNISVRELPGNHASQATTTSRPVLSARVNLLTKTEAFNDAAWGTSSVTVTQNDATAPDGTLTAATITATAASGFCRQAITGITGITVRGTIWLRRKTGTGSVFVYNGNGAGNDQATLTSSWAAFSTTPSAGSAGTNVFGVLISTSGDAVEVWHPDLRVSNNGTGIPAYQRVNTSTDYDTAGFPLYLRADGVDDWLQTGSINFSATDKMTVWAGVRNIGVTSNGMIVELSATAFSNPGTISLSTDSNGRYVVSSQGTLFSSAQSGTFSSPNTTVLATTQDIVADSLALRLNGIQAATSATDQGTGNYGTYPLYIFRRNGATLPFNGRLYSLIVRGAASTASQIAATETWVNTKTGAY